MIAWCLKDVSWASNYKITEQNWCEGLKIFSLTIRTAQIIKRYPVDGVNGLDS